MNENINLAEILKNAPKGTKLWSPVCGECRLDSIDIYNDTIQCIVEEGSFSILFDTKGRFNGFIGECVLFPSKNNRDWSTFKYPLKHKYFEPFQKVLVAACVSKLWEPDIYGYYDDKHKKHICMSRPAYDNYIIPYEGNEDKLGKQIE